MKRALAIAACTALVPCPAVPGVADGKRFAIVGSLDYAPVPRRTLWPLVVAGATAVVLLSAAGLLLASRYRAR